MSGRSATRTEQVYLRLRSDILTGQLASGARLPFAELSDRYGASMGALREALQRLVEQALVVSEPQIGFRVVTLSVDDLGDLTVARCEIEGLALRYAIDAGDLAWESEIVGALYALERTPMLDEDGGLRVEWSAAHQRFHVALLAACPNVRLRSIASGLRDSAELYRFWSSRREPAGRDVPAEHAALAEAVLARDAAAATQLLDSHLQTTARLLLPHNEEAVANLRA